MPTREFNLNEHVPPVMAIGTWLFAMYQAAHGIHWVPDDWMIEIMLSPYGASVYSWAREKLGDAVKRIPKKD